jgi:hypothetical protein
MLLLAAREDDLPRAARVAGVFDAVSAGLARSLCDRLRTARHDTKNRYRWLYRIPILSMMSRAIRKTGVPGRRGGRHSLDLGG